MARPKMFIAIGLDNQQLEMCQHPKSSPYMQTANLIFARDKKAARNKAKKLLGNSPRVLQQIGILAADLTGQEVRDQSSLIESMFVTDCNDTNEGILVGVEMLSEAKATVCLQKSENAFTCEHLQAASELARNTYKDLFALETQGNGDFQPGASDFGITLHLCNVCASGQRNGTIMFTNRGKTVSFAHGGISVAEKAGR